MRAALPEPDLSPGPFRLSCGCRDQHEEDILWNSFNALPLRLSSTGFGKVVPLEKKPWKQFRWSSKPQQKSLTAGVIPASRRRCALWLTTLPLGEAASSLHIAYVIIGEVGGNFPTRFSARQSAALRKQRPRTSIRCLTLLSGPARHAAVSFGYKSGRNSCRGIAVAASTRSTYSAGRGRPRLISCHMLPGVQPQTAASLP